MGSSRALGFSLLAIAACAGSHRPTLPVAPPAPPPPVVAPPPVVVPPPPPAPNPDDPFASIDAAANEAIEQGKMPGCVVVVGRHDEILFERAYGSRALVPERLPMRIDTVFDLASLTKPIATATSIMILVDRGKIDLDTPAAKYVPELAKLPPFTVRQLLMHASGLPAVTAIRDYALDRPALMKRLGDLTLKHQPGEKMVYSDTGYVVLEEIVRRTTGKSLAEFTQQEIFDRLSMSDTSFLPDAAHRARAAPTEMRDGIWLQGDVHDPRAHAAGGVAGHAGLFSTPADLARYAQAMLDRGRALVSQKTYDTFTTRQPNGRALGWDIDSGFSTHRSALLSPRAFGHGGYTGTAIWIDPEKDLFFVFLSNRVHPDGKGLVNPLVADLGTRIVQSVEVKTGIDVLRAEAFERLKGARIALVTNASARAKDGTTTIDAFRAAQNVTLKALFSPEHGLEAKAEGAIADASYGGVPVYSLYGERFSPTSDSLSDIDTIVVDLQDAGTRFYTYASTMKRAMKVAADRHLRFVVLDRPDPIGGVDVQGPVLTTAGANFVNHHALPVRHGMTMGELAALFADDDKLTVKLDVVRMQNWRRKDYFDRTGLTWVSPSPNLRNVAEVVNYPAIGLLEGTNLSVGRGTETPFEVVAAPWLDGDAIAKRLAGTPGVAFEPAEVTPRAAPYSGQKCGAVRMRVTDRAAFDPIRTGLAIALAIRGVHGEKFEIEKLDRLLQSKAAMALVSAGKSVDEIEAVWSEALAAFRTKRERFLLYR